MIAGVGGEGFEVPPGDPGAIDSAAAGLDTVAGALSTAAGEVSSAGSAALGSWQGPASMAFEAAVNSVRSGLEGLAGYHRHASGALRVYATALRDAQAAANQANQDYVKAVGQYETTMNNLSASPPTGPGAATRLSQTESRAGSALNDSYTLAAGAAAHAAADATHAAQVCAAKLSQIAEDVKATGLHKFLDLMAGPGALLGMLGVESEMQSGLKLWNVLSDMRVGDWTALEKVDPSAYNDVLEAVSRYGPDSMEALAAQLTYEEELASSAFGDLAQSATGIGEVPSGLAGVMDVVGKVALPIGVATDIGILVDRQSTGLDKGMAAANLGGIAVAATGTELGGTALALLGVDSVAAVIPVAGEVIIAGTALFFAGEFVYQHWDTIKQWAGDVGNFTTGVYDHAGQLVNSGLADGQHLVNVGLNDAGTVTNGVVHEGQHLVSAGLHDAAGLGKGALDTGEHLLSDLNPFG